MALDDIAALTHIDTSAMEHHINAALRTAFDAVKSMPEGAARTNAMTQLLAAHEHVNCLAQTNYEQAAHLRAAAATLNEARQQRDSANERYLKLEDAVEQWDESNPLVKALVARVRSEDGVTTEEDAATEVVMRWVQTFKANGQAVQPAQVRAFLEKVRYDELDAEMVTYLAQVVQYAANA